MSRVCAVIPTFNRANFLPETINSLFAQTRPLDEIIIVNDGSTDNTREFVLSLGNKVRLIDKPNGGKSTALNIGLDATKAEYIWIVDDDDLMSPSALEHMKSALDQNPTSGFVFGKFQVFEESEKGYLFGEPFYWARQAEPNWKISFLEGMFTAQSAMLVRKSSYDAVGPFNPKYIRSQDYEMTLRLINRFDATFVPKVLFFQRQHQGPRGSLNERFEVALQHAKWLKYDQLLFRWVRESFSLSDFTPTFAANFSPAGARRSALIERGAIMAKRALWREAIEDFESAVGDHQGLLSAEEVTILEALVDGDLIWPEAARQRGLWRGFRNSRRSGRVCRQIAMIISRPLVWRIRSNIMSGRYRDAAGLLECLIAIVGFSGLLRQVVNSALN